MSHDPNPENRQLAGQAVADAEDGADAELAALLGVTTRDLPAELHRIRAIIRRGPACT